MKKIAFLAAMAATLCTVACNKGLDTPVNEVPAQEQQLHPLTIKVKGNAPETKTTSVDPDNEVKVNTLQVIAFRNGVKDTYGTINNSDEITIQCADGGRTVYAIVNGPDVSAINTPSDLLATMCEIADWSVSNFLMVGSDWVTLPNASTMEIEVTRMVSRIKINQISRDFTVAAEAAKTLKIKKIQLSDVVIKNNLGGTYMPTATTDFDFKAGSSSSGSIAFFDDLNYTLTDGDDYSTPHSFYAFPNPTVADAAGLPWTVRHTHLVVTVEYDGATKYYNVPLPILERNKSYEIDNLTLTRPGSDDASYYLQDAEFSVSVKDWVTVPVADQTY